MQISDHENPLVRRSDAPAFQMGERAQMGLASLAVSLVLVAVVLAVALLWSLPADAADLGWSFTPAQIEAAYAHVPTPWWIAR